MLAKRSLCLPVSGRKASCQWVEALILFLYSLRNAVEIALECLVLLNSEGLVVFFRESFGYFMGDFPGVGQNYCIR
jgi:hypothetical protein